MALRRIVLLGAGSGRPDSAATQGRREAYKRLPIYADNPLLAEVIRYVDSGVTDPTTEGLLRSLAQNPNADEIVREYSRFALAKWMISCLDSRDFVERRVAALRSGEATRYPMEEQNLSRQLETFATMRQMHSWRSEALDLLRALADSGHKLRQPAVHGLDERLYLIRIDDKSTQTMPRLSELAEGLLFKESHLRPGKPAPDLDLTLVNEKTWSLAAQRGKVVIIQFSFKGCGPCEAMYPDLRELQKSHAESLSILSIMADEKQQDTLDAISEGKLTWNVHWDGRNGPIATRWAVRSFPTVYVIDTDGEVVANNMRGEELRDKVVQLLDDKSQPVQLPSHSALLNEAGDTQQFENALGWTWVVTPIEKYPGARPHAYFEKVYKSIDDGPEPMRDTSDAAEWDPFLALIEEGKDREGKDRGLVLSFVRPDTVRGIHRMRPIAIDTGGQRHELRAHMSVGSKGINLERWTSDAATLPASKVAYVGLEGLTDEGLIIETEAAGEEARKLGLSVLPIPTVGQPYRFTLTDSSGAPIDSELLHGKVVLLDFWASWCAPCIAKMPRLKELYDEHHGNGFEVIGLSLDTDDAARDKAIEENSMSWKQAVVPKENDAQQLWCKAMGLRAIPRLLLVDREGILRADCDSSQLEAELTTVLQAAKP
jgi:thiol-disulfide isomerase/thioredoxin